MGGRRVAGWGGGSAGALRRHGVKLEILRMLLYLSFPVGVFWVSNQAGYFQRHVVQRKREIFPPDNPERRRAMAELKRRLREGKGTRD
ncbi:LOW QUALITY PROTEIN: protein PET100 homolog, mitochondrial [Aptenodytes patagonicus]|uniref:LOW QUALITY PROTEIN: protein PET100 homolog, mitochondrial n=1 Tax=Aptenodytes patagonicus TaxID=9234 RepID=UPI003FA19627